MNWGERRLTAGWRSVEARCNESSYGRNKGLRGVGLRSIDIDAGGSQHFPLLIGVLALSAGGYVVLRGALAHQRGERPGRAAARAAWEVGPPLILAGGALLALFVLAVVAGTFIVMAAIAAIGRDTDLLERFFVWWFLGSLLLIVTIVAAVMWAVVRIVRGRRRG